MAPIQFPPEVRVNALQFLDYDDLIKVQLTSFGWYDTIFRHQCQLALPTCSLCDSLATLPVYGPFKYRYCDTHRYVIMATEYVSPEVHAVFGHIYTLVCANGKVDARDLHEQYIFISLYLATYGGCQTCFRMWSIDFWWQEDHTFDYIAQYLPAILRRHELDERFEAITKAHVHDTFRGGKFCTMQAAVANLYRQHGLKTWNCTRRCVFCRKHASEAKLHGCDICSKCVFITSEPFHFLTLHRRNGMYRVLRAFHMAMRHIEFSSYPLNVRLASCILHYHFSFPYKPTASYSRCTEWLGANATFYVKRCVSFLHRILPDRKM